MGCLPCFNVIDFGASEVGEANTAIQAALDAAAEAGGGTVCVPPGTYMLKHALDLGDNVHLQGSGYHVTTLILRSSEIPPQLYFEGYLTLLRILGKKGVTVSGLRLDGGKQFSEYLGCQPQFREDDTPSNRQQGILIDANPPFSWGSYVRSEDCVIRDCLIENCVTDGIYVARSRNIRIERCNVRNNGIVLPSQPDTYDNCPEKTLEHISTFLYHFVPFEPWGILLTADTEGCTIQDCSTFGNPHGGIECFGFTSKYHRILNCRADSIWVNIGDEIAQPTNHEISGCFVDNRNVYSSRQGPPGACIGSYFASELVIRDCHCVTAFNTGISLTGSDEEPDNLPYGLVIEGNTITRAEPFVTEDQKAIVSPHAPFAGINVSHLTDLSISNNAVFGEFTASAGGSGIKLVSCRQGTVTGNLAVGRETDWQGTVPINTSGIILSEGCSEITVSANSVRGYQHGIHENLSHDNVVTGNVVRNNNTPLQTGANSIYSANLT